METDKRSIGSCVPGYAYLVEYNGRKGMAKVHQSVANTVVNLKKLDHPNVVKLLDYDLEYKVPYAITEYHEGETMWNKDLTHLNIEKRKSIFKQIVAVVKYCYSKGVFCDSNFILSGGDKPILINADKPSWGKPTLQEGPIGLLKYAQDIMGIDWVVKKLAE